MRPYDDSVTRADGIRDIRKGDFAVSPTHKPQVHNDCLYFQLEAKTDLRKLFPELGAVAGPDCDIIICHFITSATMDACQSDIRFIVAKDHQPIGDIVHYLTEDEAHVLLDLCRRHYLRLVQDIANRGAVSVLPALPNTVGGDEDGNWRKTRETPVLVGSRDIQASDVSLNEDACSFTDIDGRRVYVLTPERDLDDVLGIHLGDGDTMDLTLAVEDDLTACGHNLMVTVTRDETADQEEYVHPLTESEALILLNLCRGHEARRLSRLAEQGATGLMPGDNAAWRT